MVKPIFFYPDYYLYVKNPVSPSWIIGKNNSRYKDSIDIQLSIQYINNIQIQTSQLYILFP